MLPFIPSNNSIQHCWHMWFCIRPDLHYTQHSHTSVYLQHMPHFTYPYKPNPVLIHILSISYSTPLSPHYNAVPHKLAWPHHHVSRFPLYLWSNILKYLRTYSSVLIVLCRMSQQRQTCNQWEQIMNIHKWVIDWGALITFGMISKSIVGNERISVEWYTQFLHLFIVFNWVYDDWVCFWGESAAVYFYFVFDHSWSNEMCK